MNVLLAPVGTRGDVQPLVALGRELARRGHAVKLAAPANFRSFVEGHGLAFATGCGDYVTFMDSLRDRPFLEVLRDQVDGQFSQLLEASAEADVVVGSMLQVAGPSVAAHRGIPYAYVHVAPVFLASGEHPPVTEPDQSLGATANRRAWQRRAGDWQRVLGPALNAWRDRLKLPPVADAQDHVLHSGELLLASEPLLTGRVKPDVAKVLTTGAWFLDEGELAPEVAAFCAAGEAPLFVGFGSMRFRPAAELLDLFVEAALAAGVRVIIGAGWSDMAAAGLPGSCLLVGDAPHHRLFPLARGAIHHGGAGTVHAVARAGIPPGLVPHFADQPYWGNRLWKLGLGPAPIPVERLMAANLAAMFRKLVAGSGYATRAKGIGGQINPRRGVIVAARALERLVSRR